MEPTRDVSGDMM